METAVKRGAWLALTFALAACDHAASDRAKASARPTLVPAGLDPATAAELDRLETAIRQAPSDHPLADRYRETAREHGAAQRAVKWLEQLAVDPTTGREANIQFQLGMAYIDVLEKAAAVSKPALTGRALASFDAALARDSTLWDARYAKGLIYLRMPASFKQYPKAIAEFSDLIKRQRQLPMRPQFALPYYRLSEAYLQGRDRKQAALVLRDAVRRFPDQSFLRERLDALEQEDKRP
jgi:tetratricopeptide (TPR) repeat protein